MIALPPHAPCGASAFGEIEHDSMDAVCSAVRAFVLGRVDEKGRGVWASQDGPGCGRRFRLCFHGQRFCVGCKVEETPAAR